jgi:hypothetical protein
VNILAQSAAFITKVLRLITEVSQSQQQTVNRICLHHRSRKIFCNRYAGTSPL